MSARPTTEQETFTRAASMLAERLPADWAVAFTRRGRGDAQLHLRTPDTQTAFRLKVKMRVDGSLIENLRNGTDDGVVLVTPFVSPTFQHRLRREGINYLDVTGNVRISSAAPAMFVSDQGADTDPWRGQGRPAKSLKGCPATRVVRVLLDTNRKWKIRDLITTADASTGATYRVLDLLTDEGLARRDENGEIAVVNWTELLRRWSAEYSYIDSNRITRWIAPGGLPDLLRQLRASRAPYVLTGTTAAEQWTQDKPGATLRRRGILRGCPARSS